MKKDWLQTISEKYPQNIALSEYSSTYTYYELNKQVSLIAVYLKSIKFTNRYIPVEVSHSVEFVKTILALWRIGLTPILLRESFKKNELKEILKTLGHSELITSDKQKKIVKESLEIIQQEDRSDSAFDNDEAVVIFTSGTTSDNKGVVLTFKNFEVSFNGIIAFDRYVSTDMFLASLPFNHIGGFSIMVRSLLSGGKLQLPKTLSQIDLLECILKYKPNYISLVPTQLKSLLDNNLESYDELKSIYLGGSASDTDLIEAAIDKSIPVVKVYGSTETCAMVTAVRIINDLEIIESAGKPFRGVKIWINKPDLKTKIGEICIESNSIFKKYYDASEEFDEYAPQNVFFTKDLGYINENNLLFVIGRTDDIIISGGEKVIPTEIQNYLMGIESISDAYVFGIEDSYWGQKVVAFIASDKENIVVTDIISELKKHLAGYKIPKTILKVDEIPKTTLGKYDRVRIRNLFNQMLG